MYTIQAPQPLMLVGHLPFLSPLASLLLVGDPGRTLVPFRMGGIVCLTGDPSDAGGAAGGWMVAWMLTPELAVSELSPTKVTSASG